MSRKMNYRKSAGCTICWVLAFCAVSLAASASKFIRPKKIAGESVVIATRGAWARNPGFKKPARIAKRASLDGEFFGRVRGGLWTNETYGLEMSLPPGWYLTSAPEVFERMVAAGIEVASASADAKEIMKKVGFLVMISEHPFGKPDNANFMITTEELPQPMSSEEYGRAAMEALSLAVPSIKFVKSPESAILAGEEAVRLDTLTPFEAKGEKINVHQRMFMLVRHERAFIFTFSTTPERLDSYAASIDDALKSLRFLTR